jgi:triphosphatase
MPVVSPPVETELKLELPSSEVAKLTKLASLRRAEAAKTEREISIYFDTNKLTLRKNGVMLRVRRTGNHYVQTIKAAGNRLLDRNEWETEIKDAKPDFSVMRHTALERLLTKKLRRKLRPVFETRIERKVYPLNLGGSKLQVSLDRGKIDTGNHSMSLCEVEIELKTGDRAELFKVAGAIARATSAELGVKSKAERGYELLDGKGAVAEKAESLALTPDTPAANAFRQIAASCVKQIAVNKPAVLAGNSEGVHQMRIGLRRLRAAMSLFSEILEGAESNAIKSELKWLTEELGPARAFDVFLSRVVEQARRQYPRLMGMRRFFSELAARRGASEEKARVAVQSSRFRDLLLGLAAWLETGKWRDDDLLRERGQMPIAAAAAEQLTRRSKKIRKRCKLLSDLDQQARHKLRIQAKKLRYGTEFFETVFAGKKSSKRRKVFLAALEEMQDCLGDLNDIAMHENLTTEIARHARPKSQGRDRSQEAFAAGVLTGQEEARLTAVRDAARASCARFAKAGPYWK